MKSESLTRFVHRVTVALMTALPVVVGGYAPVRASATDIEVFFTSPVTDTGAQPNIIFLLDASGSMWTPVPTASEAYDRTATYSASGCDASAYYYVVGSGTPSCSSPKITDANFFCTATKTTVELNGKYTLPAKVAEQWNRTSGPSKSRGTQWRNLQGTANTPVICQGDGTPPGTTIDVDWAAISTQGITFYDGNYLAWQASVGSASSARIDVMKEAVLELARNTDGVNISLMRFGANNSLDASNQSGACVPTLPTCNDGTLECTGQSGEGLVVMEMLGIDAAGTVDTIESKLYDETVPGQGSACDVQLFTPNGRTGMGTSLFEAYAYYRGDPTSQKNTNLSAGIGSQHAYPSVAGSRVGETLNSDRYKSPIVDGCSKNYIVMLSDGTTEQDNSADNNSIKKLKEPAGSDQDRTFAQIVGDCDTDPELGSITPTPSQCVDDLAEFMFKADASGSIPGIQNVKTFTIGFALDATARENAEPLLRSTATRGGGSYYEANDAQTLQDAFDDIVRAVLTDNATFTAPAVTVDAFNRTRNLDDVYVSLFRPDLTHRWFGNVKKFKVDDSGDIVDVNGAPAADPADGFLLSTSRSYWSAGVDGKDITLGGAASQLANWDVRNVYVNFGDTTDVDLANSGNALSQLKSYDPALAEAALGIGPTDTVSVDELVEWLYGRDAADADGDNDTTETRHDMGDPLHSRPIVLVYGGTADTPDVTDATLFVPTNDGFLHAIDTESGAERWAFIPEPLLMRARNLFENEETQPEEREYGLDANIRLLIFDNNGNGVIEPDDEAGKRDKAFLFFGMRRGGMAYYAMDVSVKNSPKLMWVNDSLPGAGQSWSTPQPARIKIGTEEKIVLFLSGGYSPDHESMTGTPPAWQQYPSPADSAGNRIYMLDAFSGALLWRAGPTTDSSANLKLPDMDHAFAADVRVLELTGDGYVDRLYAADLGGRVWRFDIFNGKSATSTTEGDRLVEGGVLASLGNAGDGSPASEATRRFFYAPDAVPFELYGRSVVNIGIGSGHRELPATDTNTRNAFFSIRDYYAKTRLLTSQYKTDCTGELEACHQIITESDADLVDLTSTVGTAATDLVPDGAKGWKIWLSQVYGEKTLAEARTLGGKVFFTTYEPTPRDNIPGACTVNFGTNKLYVVSIIDARPIYQDDMPLVTDTDGDGIVDSPFNIDTNGDGVPDAVDTNGDGVPDSYGESVGDRSTELTQSGIASEVVFLFTDQLVPGTTTGERTVFCLAGFARCPPGLSVEPVRTYWRQQGVE